jgi:hypothetical protein
MLGLFLGMVVVSHAAVTMMSDFEDGTTQGYVAQGSTSALEVDTDTPSPNSLYSLKMTVDATIDDSPKAEFYFGPVDITQYTYVSFYVKASDAAFLNGMMQMWPSEWWAGLGGHWRNEQGQGADTWFRVEYPIAAIEDWSGEPGAWKPTECNGFQVQFAKPDPLISGTIWIDHMVFSDEPGEGMLPPQQGQVMVISDFEDGTTAGYAGIDGTDSIEIDTDTPNSLSLYSLKLNIDPAVGDNPAAAPKAEYYFGPVDITQYNYVSFYVKASNAEYLNGMMQMWPSEWWVGLGGLWRNESGQGANTWFRFEYPIDAIEDWSGEPGAWKPTECNGFLLEFHMPDPPVAGNIWIDHMVFSEYSGGGALIGGPAGLKITAFSKAPEGMTVTWESQEGATYEIWNAPALAGEWNLLDTMTGAAGQETSYTDETEPGAEGYYQVVQMPPAPIFEADFEPGEDLSGWTEVVEEGVSQWEVGAPSWDPGAPTPGPDSAYSGVNVYGTVLDGVYAELNEAALRTPVIDLTNVTDATLQFWQWYDIEEEFDSGQINLLDEQGNSLLMDSLLLLEGTQPQWLRRTIKLPSEAYGKKIMIEFRLISDTLGTFAGWYIDKLQVK